MMNCALTIAGSDSVGGAGVQADIKAMAAVGVHATSVITAITSQNTFEISNVFPIPVEIVGKQLTAVLKDCDIKAIKTGMLYSEDVVDVLVEILEDFEIPLIVDPVMISTVGNSLSTGNLAYSLKKNLFPICEIVTPNKFEAEILSGIKIENEEDIMHACELIGKGGMSVLLKGGHMNTEAVKDYLYFSSEFTIFEKPRLNKAGHGSGCTLSAYIAANIAKGLDLVSSVRNSMDLIQLAIANQYTIGQGEQVVDSSTKLNEIIK